jgi:adenine-specific DNA-methyltransferase
MPAFRRYLDEMPGVALQDIWTDIRPVAPHGGERLNYDTQKPEELLERVVRSSSNEGDLVLDCFVGSGTTAAVSEKLKRRWIVCDLGRFSVHTTRKRLLTISGLNPFVVQNLGKYERQAWQVAEFPANGKDHLEEQRQREGAYRKFILDLYHANPFAGQVWLHGTKSGRMVHVAAVDAPVTLADVKSIAKETWKAYAECLPKCFWQAHHLHEPGCKHRSECEANFVVFSQSKSTELASAVATLELEHARFPSPCPISPSANRPM